MYTDLNRELGLLINALKNKDRGFILVESPRSILHSILIILKSNIASIGKDTLILSFCEKRNDEKLAAFAKRTLHKTNASVIILTDVFSHNTDIPDEKFLDLLNQAREFFDVPNKCIVFMVDRKVKKLLYSYCKDFLSWMSQKYSFSAKNIEELEVISTYMNNVSDFYKSRKKFTL